MRRFVGVISAVLFLAGCDSGPEGPGDLTAYFSQAPGPVGGAVLEVVGKGIVEFSGTGGSRVFWAQQQDASTYRVIVLGEGSSPPSLTASVEDLGNGLPRVTVVSLVSHDNLPIPVTGDYKVRFKR